MIEYNREEVTSASVYSEYLNLWVPFDINRLSLTHPLRDDIKELFANFESDLQDAEADRLYEVWKDSQL